jgi:hypothetical protein
MVAISRSDANILLSSFCVIIVLLPIVLDHPLQPLDPIQKHRNEHLSVDFTDNSAYCAFQGRPVREMDSLDLLFQKTKEEVTRG